MLLIKMMEFLLPNCFVLYVHTIAITFEILINDFIRQ